MKILLVQHARPRLQRLRAEIFQQEKDPKDTASKNLKFLKSERLPAKLMDLPAQSPDMNPLEKLWHVLDAKVKKRSTLPRNKDELYEVIEEEWRQLDSAYLKKLVYSMPRRCSRVIKDKGYWIKC